MEERGIIVKIRQKQEEPPMGSVVLDNEGDAWQRTSNGWDCVAGDDYHTEWSWEMLTGAYSVQVVYLKTD